MTSHDDTIDEQFTLQAELFAHAPALHNAASLDLLVKASSPKASDKSLDIACGPGTVAVAFAKDVYHATGLDATEAMLVQARKLAEKHGVNNVSWEQGNVYDLPFANETFDIVSCRFAFHHFDDPDKAFSEMIRVCKPGGRVVLCDAVVSDDQSKADAFNAMECFRDPSTVEFRSYSYFANLFEAHGLQQPEVSYYHVPVELEALCKVSFPKDNDHDSLRRMIINSIDGDLMGVNARYKGDQIRFEYSAVIMVSESK